MVFPPPLASLANEAQSTEVASCCPAGRWPRLTRKAHMRMQSVTGLADSPEERPVRVIG